MAPKEAELDFGLQGSTGLLGLKKSFLIFSVSISLCCSVVDPWFSSHCIGGLKCELKFFIDQSHCAQNFQILSFTYIPSSVKKQFSDKEHKTSNNICTSLGIPGKTSKPSSR